VRGSTRRGEQVYTGGVRFEWSYVTWPLARLFVERDGIRVEPSRKAFLPLFRLAGLKDLTFDWREIGTISPYEGFIPALPLSHGLLFAVGGRTMTWWARSARDASRVLADIGELVPEKVRSA
jgi:hypothetical protein